jgi:transglutaminase-like putative cysteine protease
LRYSSRRTLGDIASPSVFLPQSPTSALLQTIPDGDPGTLQTLRLMKGYARQSLKHPQQIVRGYTLLAVQGVTPRDWRAEVRALQEWVRDQIEYRMDPDQIELVQTPEKTLEFGAGDCDDKATLLASMLLAIGHPARFCAAAIDGDEFSHVMVQSKVGEQWIMLETIIAGAPMGWYPPGIRRTYFLSV